MPGLGDFGERRCVYFRYCAGRHQNGDTDVPSGIARDTLRVAPRFTHLKTDYDNESRISFNSRPAVVGLVRVGEMRPGTRALHGQSAQWYHFILWT